MTINQRVKVFFNLLKSKGINQNKFCEVTGYNEKNLSNALKPSTKKISADLISAILEYDENINPYWILGIEGHEMFIKEEDEELLNLINKAADKTNKNLAAETMTEAQLEEMLSMNKENFEELKADIKFIKGVLKKQGFIK